MSSSSCGQTGHFLHRSRLKTLSISFSILRRKNYRSDCCALTICLFPSIVLYLSWPRCLSWFPDFQDVEQNPRIPRLEFSEFVTATNCVYFIPSRVSLMFDVLHTVINSVYAQLVNRASHLNCNRLWFVGLWPLHSRLYGQSLTTVGRTSLRVIIIIVI